MGTRSSHIHHQQPLAGPVCMAENTQAQRHTPLVTCRVDAKYERRATGHCNAETQLADTPLVRMPNMKEGSLDTAMLKRS